MKHIFAYTLSFVAIAASALLLTKASRADDPEPPAALTKYNNAGGVATAKEVSAQNTDGSYTIKLETFATGESDLEVKSVPSDIILVLDISSSMNSGSYPGFSNRLAALKDAVIKFAGSIYDNAEKARETDPDFINRLAIITYNRNATMTQSWVSVDDDVIQKSGNTYSGSLVNTINRISYASGTRPDHGLQMAIDMLLDGTPNAKREGANLTVLLFTDGYPTDNNASNWGEPTNAGDTDKLENSFANKTLYYGSIVKQTYGATLYTVGLITTPTAGKPANPMQYYYEANPGGRQEDAWRAAYRWRNYCRVLQMMDWLSSNYPNAKWADGVVDQSKLAIESPSTATAPTGASEYNYYAGFSTSTNVPGTYNNVFRGENNIDAPWKNVWTYAATSGDLTDVVTLADFVPGSTDSDGDKFTWQDGYFKIIDENTAFDSVFKEIAEASGGSTETIGATTQVRDVVSSSFVLPEGAASDLSKINLKIYTEDIKSDASTWINRTQLYPVESGNPSVSPSIVTTTDGHEALYVEGFDYSLDDDPENSGNGNWVGIRYDSNGHPYYAGKKLVIEFDIHVNGDATGGQGTNTNTSDSGVYVLQDDGVTYKNVNSYEIPHTTVPINIVITKTGLRHGESATFEIHRAPVLKINGVIQYNALGKAMPDDDNWDENFSKVIVTNKGENGAAVTKTLLSLDPAYVYRVAEDKWGWAYTMTGQGGTLTTAQVEVNPFRFNNEEKEDAAKHAEAVTINHFQSPMYGESTEEHYKSSKVESF